MRPISLHSIHSNKKINLGVSYLTTVLLVLFLIRCISLMILLKMQYVEHWLNILSMGMFQDLLFGLITWPMTILLSLFKRRVWRKVFFVIIGFLLVFELVSNFYFFITLTLLDRTLYQFSIADILNIIRIFGDFKWYYLLLVLPIPLVFIGTRIFKRNPLTTFSILFLMIVISMLSFFNEKEHQMEFEKRFIENKTLFFISDSYDYFLQEYKKNDIKVAQLGTKTYPLLHKVSEENSLAPFFNLKQQPPNIVFLMIESLSSSFSGPQAQEISFTPFLDSLAQHSIYFKNFISTAERTFGVLPSSLASLPHGEIGFLKMGLNMPNHLSILSILVNNGYHATFFYGGDANYDNMRIFMENNGVKTIVDHAQEYGDSKIRWTEHKTVYGEGDQQLFQEAAKRWQHQSDTPFVHCYLTLSTHQPFILENQKYYEQQAKQMIETQSTKKGLNKERYLKSTQIFSTFVYLDDAIKGLITQYAKEPSFDNTIFFIYGDHMLAPVPKKNSLKKYHVPLYIYSPLLKRNKTIGAINTHLDIPPSILSLLKSSLSSSPKAVSWLGQPFDTSRSVNRNRQLSLMLNNRERANFIAHDLYLDKGELFKIDTLLNTHLINNPKRLDSVQHIEDSMVMEQNWALNNNQLVKNSQPTKFLAEQQLSEGPIFRNEEYTMLFKYSFEKAQAELLLDIQISFKQNIPIIKPLKAAPVLVLTIKNEEGEKVLWESIDYPYPNDSNSYLIQTSKYIKANSLLPLSKGSVLKMYFWRNKRADTNFVITQSDIKLYTVIK